MSEYKQGIREKVRFTTKKGELSIEQLWDLGLEPLNTLAVELDDQYNESGKKSFLVTRSEKDKTIKLKLDIVLDVLNTKKEEAEARKIEKERKENNEKVLAIIAKKKEGALENMPIEELEKLLK